MENLRFPWLLGKQECIFLSICFQLLTHGGTTVQDTISVLGLLPPLAGCEHAGLSGQWQPCSHHLKERKDKRQKEMFLMFFVHTHRTCHSFLCVCFFLTSWHNDISQPHSWLDVLLKRRLHKLVILLDDAFDVPSTLCDVPAQSTHQPDVGVCVHKDFHIQELKARRGKTPELFNNCSLFHQSTCTNSRT